MRGTKERTGVWQVQASVPWISVLRIGLLSAITVVSGCAGNRVFDRGEVAQSHGRKAFHYFVNGHLSGSIRSYTRAFAEATVSDVPHLQAKYLFNIGRSYYEMGRFDSSIAYFERAHDEFDALQDNDARSTCAGFIALTLSYAGQHSESQDWLRRSQESSHALSFMLLVEAQILLNRSEFAGAEEKLGLAEQRLIDSKEVSSLAMVKFYQGILALKTGDYQKSLVALERSLALLDSTPERYRRWRVLLAASEASFCRGDEISGKRYHQRATGCTPRDVVCPTLDQVSRCGLETGQ